MIKCKKIMSYILIFTILILTGCASHSSAIIGSSQSANLYANYDCEQLVNEIAFLNSDLSRLTMAQDQIHKRDKTMGWVGSFLLWPMYFLIKGDGAIATELSAVKGKISAVDKAIILKKCNN